VNPVDLKALEADSAPDEYVPKTEVRALIAALRIAIGALDCVAKGPHSRRFAEETLAQLAKRVKVSP
jgi:hypothetical protein